MDRSAIMRKVKSKDTLPELKVRQALHSAGLRFRLHQRDLPGCPDIVLPRWRTVLFVHGCWWHGHHCRRGARTPKTNSEYWLAKVTRNKTRDARVVADLNKAGWRVAIVWECEVRDNVTLQARLSELFRR